MMRTTLAAALLALPALAFATPPVSPFAPGETNDPMIWGQRAERIDFAYGQAAVRVGQMRENTNVIGQNLPAAGDGGACSTAKLSATHSMKRPPPPLWIPLLPPLRS